MLKQTVASIPDAYKGPNEAVDIKVHSNGRFLYASNRGSGLLAIYEIAADDKLKLVGFESAWGHAPRTHWFTPDARLLLVANQDTNEVTALGVDPETGMLQPTGAVTRMPAPAGIAFLEV